MHDAVDAFLRSWPAAPWSTALLIATAAVYLRGWLHLRWHDPRRWTAGRLAALVAGLATIWLAIASPLDTFAPLVLQAHMAQHLLLTMVAPPLVWLGWPLLPMVRGLPEPVRTVWVAPLLRSRALRRLFSWATSLPVAWCAFVGATWLWHTPAGYELALGDARWHLVEHACFFVTAALFWFPVVRPFPARRGAADWLLFPYLILADVQNTVLSAWLTFSSRVLYPHYESVPRLGGLSALDDQAAAGVMMWVPGSIAFLLPLAWIGVRMIRGAARDATPLERASRELAIAGSRPAMKSALDLVDVPWLGRLLKSRLTRPTVQLLAALCAVAIVYDGLTGPPTAGMNLAGVAPWIHWRGLLVFGLLVGGNVFCFACPFTLPRRAAGRWLTGDRPWPRWLSSKWLAVGLTAIFLWSYETFALWDRPAATAWIAVAYFAAALAVDGWFRAGSFCKYVCPIGQFNFVHALVSPLEVKVRDAAGCAGCRTMECIRGSERVAGCETLLFQPRKRGNLDCTFCLDCVRACPRENVGVLTVMPGESLWTGAGQQSQRRFDVAALVLVVAFGAFANAAGMVAPVLAWQDRLCDWAGGMPAWGATTLFYVFALLILPALSTGAAAMAARRGAALSESLPAIVARYAWALIPLGLAMWTAHYSYHLLTSAGAIVPVVQRLAADLGWHALGAPHWQFACCAPAAEWIPYFEVLLLDVGALLSLYAALRIAEAHLGSAAQAWRAFAPWGALIVALFVVGCWVVFQSMEMRGLLAPGGSGP